MFGRFSWITRAASMGTVLSNCCLQVVLRCVYWGQE